MNMRYIGRKRPIWALSMAIMMTMGLMTSYGAVTEATVKSEADPYRVNELKAAQDTDQLIVVVGEEGYQVTVSYYKKENTGAKKGPGEAGGDGTWKQVFQTAGVYGKNGSTAEKREGDGKTPQGTYQFSQAFGIKEDPGSVLDYHRIVEGDYWVDDSDSPYYNKLVNTNKTKQTWKSAEDMLASAPFYNYGLVLNYNEDCVPGAGSAIFMHCTKSTADTGSQGCIRIPEELMKQVLQSVDEKSRIIIVSDAEQLEYVK